MSSGRTNAAVGGGGAGAEMVTIKVRRVSVEPDGHIQYFNGEEFVHQTFYDSSFTSFSVPKYSAVTVWGFFMEAFPQFPETGEYVKVPVPNAWREEEVSFMPLTDCEVSI